MRNRRYIFTVLFALALAAPIVALAQTSTFVPLAPNPARSTLNYTTGTGGLAAYINTLFKIAISVGAMLAVLRLVYAGYIYMVSGVGNFASMGKAKEIIGSVVLGLLLLLGIYLILYQINPDILKLDITQNIQPLQSGGVPCGANGCPLN